MEKTDAAISAVITKLDALIANHAAQGIEVTLKAMWWHELFDLLNGLAYLALAFLAAYLVVKLWKEGTKADWDPDKVSGWLVGGLIVGGGATFISTIIGFACLASTSWVTLVDPRYGLALKLLRVVGL
ncbi:hypothetical protein SAMN02745126_03980 [Enhydrobacter aerosaccus]|uniref:Uncharacterized protein n=1 Tax=Enhydrobacter aerosaccus TaxID=225324 RepID=A0A1T4RNB7_9HYPH|nr:hypothetical protein [Enhydrobacter aerosaccus]SKA17505.1 hypothetical protein SAMN02745126_03980 [Enhydrobacter aerosaccus]